MRTALILSLLAFIGCTPATTVCTSVWPDMPGLDACSGPTRDLPREGDFTLTLKTGWYPGDVQHATQWTQGHNPFTTATDGSDYELLDGSPPRSESCGPFNGLHATGSFSEVSDADADDHPSCWRMQVLPTEPYPAWDSYMDGYGPNGMGRHMWQELTVELL